MLQKQLSFTIEAVLCSWSCGLPGGHDQLWSWWGLSWTENALGQPAFQSKHDQGCERSILPLPAGCAPACWRCLHRQSRCRCECGTAAAVGSRRLQPPAAPQRPHPRTTPAHAGDIMRAENTALPRLPVRGWRQSHPGTNAQCASSTLSENCMVRVLKGECVTHVIANAEHSISLP